ncbi:hypothetical protein MMC28_004928 [Mycoblastus sanguinarius]|nr:hypothetical protein [Mycoblastus sanguinarius]
MPSRMSIRTRQTDDSGSLVSAEDIVYRHLSFEDDLFTGIVYKRNFIKNILRRSLKSKPQMDSGVATPRSATPTPRRPSIHVNSNSSISGLQHSRVRNEDVVRGKVPSQDESLPRKDAPPENQDVPQDQGSLREESLPQESVCADDLQTHQGEGEYIRKTAEWGVLSGPSLLRIEKLESLSEDDVSSDLSLRDKSKSGWPPNSHGAIARMGPEPITSKRFMSACERGYHSMVKTFLENGYNAHTQAADSDLRFRAMHAAVSYGNMYIVQTLLKSGASLEDENFFTGMRPLHLAARSGNVPMIKLLLRSGACVSTENKLGEQPIHLASRSGVLETLSVLIDGGAVLDHYDRDGRQPLHCAAESLDQPDVIKLLASKGANIDRATLFSYEVPIHIACRRDLAGNVRILLEIRAGMRVYYNAKRLQHYHFHKDLLDKVICCGSLSVLKMLLEHEIDPDQPNDLHGSTALHRVVSKRDFLPSSITKGVQLLMEYHPNVDAQDLIGDTVLHILTRVPRSDTSGIELQLAEIILAQNANSNLTNNVGVTALLLAAANHKTEVIQVLINSGARTLVELDGLCVGLFVSQVEAPAEHDTRYYELRTSGPKIDSPDIKIACLYMLHLIHAHFKKSGIDCVIKDLKDDLDADGEVASTWQPKKRLNMGEPRMAVAMSSILSELGTSHLSFRSSSHFDQGEKEN